MPPTYGMQNIHNRTYTVFKHRSICNKQLEYTHIIMFASTWKDTSYISTTVLHEQKQTSNPSGPGGK